MVAEAAGATLEMLGRTPKEAEVKRAMAMPGGGIHRVAPGQVNIVLTELIAFRSLMMEN
jgi:hypothetical protein